MGNFCLENRNFYKLPEKIEICLEKSKFFVKLPENNRNFSEICLEESKYF